MEMLLPLKSTVAESDDEQPKTNPPTDDEIKRYAGRYEHAPQTWEVFTKDGKLFIKQDGKQFELKKIGDNQFQFEQGGVLFVPNEKGEIEHIFMGLYAARKAKN